MLSVPTFFTCTDWREPGNFAGMVIRATLKTRLENMLSPGPNRFSSIHELFNKLGIEHLDSGDVELRDIDGCVVSMNAPEIFLKMSYRSFARLIHTIPSVRIQQNSWELVNREGESRILVTVS